LKKIFILLLLATRFNTQAQTLIQDSIAVNNIAGLMLEQSNGYNDLRVLCKQIGHRLTGSKAAEQAVEWGRKALLEAGCDKVYLQPVMVPKWVRENEHFTITLKNRTVVTLNPIGLGNTLGTAPQGVTAPIIQVDNEKD
jgi:carboxypeptidase Q